MTDGRRRGGIDEVAELGEAVGVVSGGADGLEDPDVGGEGCGEGLDGGGVGHVEAAFEEGGPAGFAEDVVNEGEVVAFGDDGGGVEAGAGRGGVSGVGMEMGRASVRMSGDGYVSRRIAEIRNIC